MANKADALTRVLKERLEFRLSSKSVALSSDANGNPILLISDGTAAVGEDNLLIRIAPMADDIARKDALGLSQRVYAPHTIDILEQKNATTTVTTTHATLAQALCEIAKLGCDAKLWAQADATNAVVAATQIAAATLVADLKDILNPAIGSV
jgi:hypothetical protein